MFYPVQNEVRNKLDLSGIWDFRIDPDAVEAHANTWLGTTRADSPRLVTK